MSVTSASTLTTGTGAGAATSSAGVEFVPYSPCDFLLTWSTDIRLYRITEKEQATDEALSPSLGFRLSSRHIAEISNFIPKTPHYVKCVSVGNVKDAGAIPRELGLAPLASPDIRLAVGEANGRVSILSFDKQPGEPRAPLEEDAEEDEGDGDYIVKEFIPRSTPRAVNDVAWNRAPGHEHLLAAAYEKARNDGGILVYDTEGGGASPAPPKISSTIASAAAAAAASSMSKLALHSDKADLSSVAAAGKEIQPALHPVVELATGETCHSLAWWRNKPTTIVAGMNGKSLKIFDIRVDTAGSGRASGGSNFTRAVYGVCIDPFLDSRIASRHDNHVVIWDSRNFDKPIVTLTQPRKIRHMAWCPNRGGLLCSSMVNSPQMTIHDIQSWAYMAEDGEPAVTERSIKGFDVMAAPSPSSLDRPTTAQAESDPADVATSSAADDGALNDGVERDAAVDASSGYFVSFAWHPRDDRAIVGVTQAGRLAEVDVPERIAPSWSALHSITWAHGRKLQIFREDSQLFSAVADISEAMYRRADTEYGSESPLSENAKYVSDGENGIAHAWKWLESSGKLSTDNAAVKEVDGGMKHPGVRAALKLDAEDEAKGSQNSEVVPIAWKIGALSEGLHLKKKTTYRSNLRLVAQKLCGWTTYSEDLDCFIQKCEADNEYSRAAAVAVFCLQLNTALQVLDRGASGAKSAEQAAAYNLVAISLSGFASIGDGLWKRMVRSHQAQIKDAYLRAAFLFLTADEAEEESYKAILALDGLELSDKVSFGCVYLSDERLSSVINEFWTEFRNRGDLRGLVLCGMGPDGVELLQSYLDHTGDIQSVCWLIVRCLEPALAVTSVETEESVASRLQNWFITYKELLDTWQMWTPRAKFDCAVQMARMLCNAPQQVFISCTYCGTSVARNMKGLPSWVGNGAVMGGNNPHTNPDLRAISTFMRQANAKRNIKVQACPQCRKTLPRCAVCLLSMGTHSGLMLSTQRPAEGSKKVTPFKTAFTWCQTCRHGGHAEHITNWFAEHPDCPISGCGCKCATVDPLSQTVQEKTGSSPAGTQTQPLRGQRRE